MTVSTAIPEKRNPYLTKWYVLFDNKNDQWISFQPQVGHVVYPCYACRDMFGSRNSFLDHVNRRGMVCKYKCPSCSHQKTFYNICSFLLHCRDHFSELGGQIDLDNVEISTIPMDIAGFLPVPSIPLLYDSKDDTSILNLNINVKFYKPSDDCIGKRVVIFFPNDLIFFCSANNNNISKENDALILKQVNETIPKCIFVSVIPPADKNTSNIDNIIMEEDVICLDDEDNHMANEDIKPQILAEHSNSLPNGSNNSKSKDGDMIPNCPECKIPQRIMQDHFQKITQPIADNYRCRICGLISTSACALKAHIRIHDKTPPFVCPECSVDFEVWEELENHMEFACFHTAKIVRYKCPAKKCGKVFAQNVTFSSHFPVAHMKVRFACNMCSLYFASEIDFNIHRVSHENASNISFTRIHECTVCSAPAKNIKQHVLNHVNNKDNRIFVYICRYCRSCYRSKQTYGVHIMKCTKLLLNNQVKKEVLRSESQSELKCKVIKYCRPCNSRVHFSCTYKEISKISDECPKCLLPFSNEYTVKGTPNLDYEHTSNYFVMRNMENDDFLCILCNSTLGNDDKPIDYAEHFCKFRNPIVIVNKINFDKVNSRILENLDTFEDRQVSPNSDDSSKRKRKRLLNGSFKKIQHAENEDILTADPIPFDGEYKCKLCDFKNESRTLFHDHIQIHRDISTSYQCMECGECFVVKPSLIKHLQVYHLVQDIDSYMAENECFDKEAVRMLEESMRMVPGEVKEPVAENQCRICRQMFPDAQELSKHFRVHGMAFLMKKIIK